MNEVFAETDNRQIDRQDDLLRKYCAGEERAREIEQSITGRRRFKEHIFHRFTKAIVEFDMIQPGDKIAVCISGGKDSMLMAKLFQELKRHDKFPFELVFLVMDPGYNPINRLMIESNARIMDIPITVFEVSIFDAVYKIEKSPCYLCARMRRGWLYKKARELGCSKIALGHHYDDVIETILMGMLWGGQVQTMMPKLHSANYEGMELIRPLYYVRENDIKAWRDHNRLRFLQCACRFTEACDTGTADSKRQDTKRLIQELKKTNPRVEANIFNSMHNVNVDTVIAYKKDGVVHHFLEDYNESR
ncbi:MAG: ATPase [Ruminococcus sp.]|nr:ATPase [Ruminococcus sp.]